MNREPPSTRRVTIETREDGTKVEPVQFATKQQAPGWQIESSWRPNDRQQSHTITGPSPRQAPAWQNSSWRPKDRQPPQTAAPQNSSTSAPAWLKKGVVAHLPYYNEREHRNSRLVSELARQEYFNPEGFFGHPVLVFSNPGDKDYVRVFPMTSYGNKSAEEKWSGMHNPQEKAERLDQLPQIEHPGVPASGHSALLRLGPGQKLQKRSYVCLTNGGYNVETKLLTHYGRGDTPSLDQNSIAALERLARKYDQH
ncbi:hypothetical protein IWZ01DRAFT_561572 [Phyllosticta capitalensis]